MLSRLVGTQSIESLQGEPTLDRQRAGCHNSDEHGCVRFQLERSCNRDGVQLLGMGVGLPYEIQNLGRASELKSVRGIFSLEFDGLVAGEGAALPIDAEHHAGGRQRHQDPAGTWEAREGRRVFLGDAHPPPSRALDSRALTAAVLPRLDAA
jgi:hypothetical protein